MNKLTINLILFFLLIFILNFTKILFIYFIKLLSLFQLRKLIKKSNLQRAGKISLKISQNIFIFFQGFVPNCYLLHLIYTLFYLV